MKTPILVLTLSALLLAGCGSVRESRLNPFTWFGQSRSEPVAASGAVNPLIPPRRAGIFRSQQDDSYPGAPVGEVTELLIERRPGGAILRASGVVDSLDFHDVRLVPNEEASDGDTLTYALSAVAVPAAQGPARARTVTAAVWLTDSELQDIRAIRVTAERNSRVSRR